MRMHTAKHLELLCLDPEDSSILRSIYFQVNLNFFTQKLKQSNGNTLIYKYFIHHHKRFNSNILSTKTQTRLRNYKNNVF